MSKRADELSHHLRLYGDAVGVTHLDCLSIWTLVLVSKMLGHTILWYINNDEVSFLWSPTKWLLLLYPCGLTPSPARRSSHYSQAILVSQAHQSLHPRPPTVHILATTIGVPLSTPTMSPPTTRSSPSAVRSPHPQLASQILTSNPDLARTVYPSIPTKHLHIAARRIQEGGALPSPSDPWKAAIFHTG